jgi:hypothetical protein
MRFHKNLKEGYIMKKRIIASAIGLALSGSVVAAETPATYGSSDDLMNVHNRCIVQLRSNIDASRVRGIAKNMAAQARGSLRHVYKNSINGFTINMPCQSGLFSHQQERFAEHG